MTVVNVHNNKNFDVYIGRSPQGGEWRFGNPFVVGRDGNREQCVAMFENWLIQGLTFNCIDATKERRQWILDNLHTLKGKVLGCFCKPGFCHGDSLILLCKKRKKFFLDYVPIVQQTESNP